MARSLDEHEASNNSMVTYAIDGNDRLVAINTAWTAFAEENNGVDLLLPEQVIGRPIWDFFADMAVDEIYRLIFAHVRNGHPTSVPMRCDSDDTCRWIELQLTPLPDNGIAFEIHTQHTISRAPVQILDPALPRSKRFLRICSWCKRISADSTTWYEIDEALTVLSIFDEPVPPQLTHVMCEACYNSLQSTFGPSGGMAA